MNMVLLALSLILALGAATPLQLSISIPLPDPLADPIGSIGPSGLPPCSPLDRPCVCPRGSTFHNISTLAILGAPAFAVREVMASFFKTEWFGSVPDGTLGADFRVGAVRTFWFEGENGDGFRLDEELTDYAEYPDGGFVQSYAQTSDEDEIPNVQKPPSMGGGTFRGFYGTINAQQTVIANETAVAYTQYRCDVGTPYDTAKNNEASLRNVSFILFNMGKLTGFDIAPYSIRYA